MTTTTPTRPTPSTTSAAELTPELLAVLKRMRLPYLRAIAPDVLPWLLTGSAIAATIGRWLGGISWNEAQTETFRAL